MAVPNQIPKLIFPEASPEFQQHYSSLCDAVNTLAGHNGTIELASHIDMGGNRIQNVGEAVSSSDVLSSGTAESKYSASSIRPQLESTGSSPLSTYRQMNNGSQREQSSSYLNDLMSTTPSANSIYPTVTNVTGGASISIPESTFEFADGTTITINARTDLVSLPSEYAITSITMSGNTMTVNCAATGIVAGEIATIVSSSQTTNNGTFQVTSSTSGGAVLEMQNPSGVADATGTGYVQVNSVYYYTLLKKSKNLVLRGSFSADTSVNRLSVCKDGSQIVAVVVVTSSGAQVDQSGGGGSPITGSPTAGSFF